ncbi:MAG TPA: aminoglycoside phosphotransferase family protein [Pirellulales bacterium]|nr:aminoglycoside phosphotransferase family protein [Pirellulales bacterium]
MHALDPSTGDQAIDRRMAIETMLSEHFGRSVRVVQLHRQPFAYQTSATIELWEVELDDGARLPLLMKDLSRAALQPTARLTKPAFLHNPLREIAVYRHLLAEGEPGTAVCYGSLADAYGNRFWLLIERVGGRELYQIGEPALWQAAARWLARMHCLWAGRIEEIQRRAPLLNHDGAFYHSWLERAIQFQQQHGQLGLIAWQRLVDGYDAVIERLVALPKTFLHGEFYASNVLIDDACQPLRVCPVDWEMAAVGPGLTDLAALAAGRWSDDERTALLDAYHSGLVECGAEPCSVADLRRELELCRLHVAVQWLGWSPKWTPPAEHAHDWLGEALQLAEKIGL